MVQSEIHDPVKSKLAKWVMFVVGLLFATVAGESFAALINQEPLSAARLFGRGELLVASIGLLVAAAADLLFDRLLRGRAQILHAVVLALLFLLILAVAITYGATRVELTGQSLAQTTERGAVRAQLSACALVASIAFSGYGVYLSEAGQHVD